MDDGNLAPHKRNNKIHSYELMLNTGLQKDENKILIDYFQEKWGIKFNQYKNKNVYRLCCGTKMARKFLEIIKPYSNEIKCMDYKINMTYNLP
jgi:predicted transcriptional regulator